MKLTNKYGLPRPLVSAIENDPYKKVGDISITSLINAPRQRQLLIRHDQKITEDASERIWMLLGSSVHAILERADTRNHLVEERLTAKVLGWTVSGQPDLLGPDGVLTDWKCCGVFSLLLGEKPDWVHQLQCYAWLYRQNGFTITKLQIVAILRDWMQSRAKQEPDNYPQCPVETVDIPLWHEKDQESYIHERVKLHQFSQHQDDRSLPLCTPEERWERPTSYAVQKPMNKRARRVFDSKDKATAEAGAQEVVITRHGVSVRCVDYCKASPFCNQFLTL